MKNPTISIEDVRFKVIYIRMKGTYAEFRKSSKAMFHELLEFADKEGLVEEGVTKVMTLYHDNPFITNEKNLKTSVAMSVPHDAKIKEEGRIGTMEFSGKYAVLHFELTLKEYGDAWKYAYQEWLFKNLDSKPRDDFPFELYVNEPPKNFKDTSFADIYIPIE